ncbi:Rha family transcriptional regulator [Thiorhodospira sibirica]|uniref:Rha family transcriptional regulator n=1 Tax=Thiorhodospira sibirica TaxID=154347 RepID=UPI00022C0532|nr:Rha family transcriptional regulator [Thiorhodospira sibirica]
MSIYSACAPLHTLSLSSREIAALTGKRHDNIMRDIRVMLEQLPKFGLSRNSRH